MSGALTDGLADRTPTPDLPDQARDLLDALSRQAPRHGYVRGDLLRPAPGSGADRDRLCIVVEVLADAIEAHPTLTDAIERRPGIASLPALIIGPLRLDLVVARAVHGVLVPTYADSRLLTRYLGRVTARRADVDEEAVTRLATEIADENGEADHRPRIAEAREILSNLLPDTEADHGR